MKFNENVEMQKVYVKKCTWYRPFLSIYKTGKEVSKLCLNATLVIETEIVDNLKCMLIYLVH